MTRGLTNQDAFDVAILNFLNQGHSCVSASGRPRYRSPRGKSAIGALIPDALYVASMEGSNVHHWLAARGSEYDALRERLGSVTPTLLDELQDLHDRIGACMPSLYRQLAVAGAQRIAQSFKLSMSLVNRAVTSRYLRGPRLVIPAGTVVAEPATAAVVVSLVPTATAAPTSTPNLSQVPAASAPAAVAPDQAAAPTPAPTVPVQLAESPEDDLDLIARGIARAIAAARGLDQRGS